MRAGLMGIGLAALLLASHAASSTDMGMTRTELKRTDLSGAEGMEVISSVLEVPPGASIPRHLHHGVEMFYVLEGAMIQFPGKEPALLATGAAGTNLRNVPHAGFVVVGDKPLKLFTVHTVDKGKPLMDEDIKE
jgi:quercetin dioxygenase-like cupin family protein